MISYYLNNLASFDVAEMETFDIERSDNSGRLNEEHQGTWQELLTYELRAEIQWRRSQLDVVWIRIH